MFIPVFQDGQSCKKKKQPKFRGILFSKHLCSYYLKFVISEFFHFFTKVAMFEFIRNFKYYKNIPVKIK